MIAGAKNTLVVKVEDTLEFIVSYKKPSSTTFEELSLSSEDIVACERGYFNILLKPEWLLEIGTYIFLIEGYEYSQEISKEVMPLPLSSLPAPGTCIVTGNVRNLTGEYQSYQNTIISATPLKLPSSVAGTLIIGGKVSTYSNHDGFFSMPLIVGMQVILEIPDAGVRFKAVIPDLPTVRLEDLMP